MDNVMDNVIKVTGDMEADMRVLLSHYLTPSDVDYYMNNDLHEQIQRPQNNPTSNDKTVIFG